MKPIKKYTAIQLYTDNVNQEITVNLTYGNISGPYYSQEYPEQEFDTEEQAIEYAYKKSKYSSWLILPIVKFDNY